MAWSTGMRKDIARAVVALTLLPPAGVAAADSTLSTSPPVEITEVGGKKLKDWIADLKGSADPSVREEAIRAIILFPNAADAVPALLDRIHDPDESPRMKAVLALGTVKIDDKDKAPVAKKLGERLIEESQGPIRFDIVLVLGGLGKDAREALSGLLSQHGVEDPSSFEIRRASISVAAQAGMTDNGPDPRVTRSLMTALTDRASQVRLQAVMGMAQMGKPADPDLLAREINAVKTLENDKDKTVVIWAHLSRMALDKIDDADIAYLTQSAQSGEAERIRVQAVGALGMVGTKEKKVVPVLVDLLTEKDVPPAIVAAACQALGVVGEPGEKAEAALVAVAHNKDMDEQVRIQAVYALGTIGAKDKKAIAILAGLLAEKNTNVLFAVCHVLGSLDDPAAEQALSALVQNKDTEEPIRKYINQILDSIRKPKLK